MLSSAGVAPDISIPTLAFLGLGWIGRNRMQSILKSGLAKAGVAADPQKSSLGEDLQFAGNINCVNDLNEILLINGLDGVVIATPNSLHASQSAACLENELAVFCQKPLGRTAGETKFVIETAERKNILLGVDLSYRYTDAYQKIYKIIKEGKLGKIFAVDLVFHNAYGPGKEWFYNPVISGGGCVIDLGIHLIDMALFALDFPGIKKVEGKLFSKGEEILIADADNVVEDYASVNIDLEDNISLHLKCSWNLPLGQFAVIEASFYGTKAGVSFRNVNGSYYDFTAEFYNNITTEILSQPPDDWSGRAAINWVKKLSLSNKFDPEVKDCIKAAEIIDTIYSRGNIENNV